MEKAARLAPHASCHRGEKASSQHPVTPPNHLTGAPKLIILWTHRKEADTMSTKYASEEEARRAKNIAKDRYDKENTRPLKLKLNLKLDADILAKLETVPSMQGYPPMPEVKR